MNMISVLIGAIANIGLCILFMGPLNMGLLGAGLSPLIAELIILFIRRVTTYKYIQIKVKPIIYISILLVAASIATVTFVTNSLIFIITGSIILLVLLFSLFKELKQLIIFFIKKEENKV